MTFDEALNILGISEYRERIYNSNSRGELFHLYDYIVIASTLEELEEDLTALFPEWFNSVVKAAEEEWERPESIFQHIPRFIQGQIKSE